MLPVFILFLTDLQLVAMFSETKQALRQNNEHGWTINFSSVSTHMCLCCKHHRVQDEHMSSGRGGGRGPKVYHCSWMICLHQEPETDPLNDSSFWGAERKWKNRCWGQLSPGADVVSLYVVRPPAERRFGSDPECFLSSSACFVSLFYSADNIMTWRCVWLKSCEGKQNNKLHGGRASCAGWVWFLLQYLAQFIHTHPHAHAHAFLFLYTEDAQMHQRALH